MQFNSYGFMFVFLPIAVGGYWVLLRLTGHNVVLAGLTLASVVFYTYGGAVNLLVIGPSVLFNYLIARAMLRTTEAVAKRTLLVAGITGNVLFLSYFKYKEVVLEAMNAVLPTHFQIVSLLLPLGISFITFQNIMFLSDVWAGDVKETRLRDFLLFTLFFPRVVAGPLVRYNELIPQLVNPRRSTPAADLQVAISLLSIGFFKKSVIADQLGALVSPTFDTSTPPLPIDMLTAWVGVMAFTLQIYFDFSGYSDMALGIARMFGVRLPMNFNSPLKARSVIEFWSRWHISLTRFLTAYIYTPMLLRFSRGRAARGKPLLAGKRSKPSAVLTLVAVPTIITMLISGLWHGVGTQFAVWGLLHGIYLTVNQSWRMLRSRICPDLGRYERLIAPCGLLLTLASVAVSMVFFRASSVSSGWAIVLGMIGANGLLPYYIQLQHSLGISVGLEMLWSVTAGLRWVMGLLLCVILLPNSLELLRRFDPALDFPAKSESHGPKEPPTLGENRWPAVGRRGIALNALAAVVAALLFVLSSLSISAGGAFLYWKF